MALGDINERTAVKAAIKRATLGAHARMYSLDDASQEQLRQIYQDAHDDIVQRIHDAGAGGGVRLEKLRQLQGDIDQRLNLLSAKRDGVLLENMNTAAKHGVDPFASIHDGPQLHQIADAAVRSSSGFVDEDGLQLSDRLWRLDHNAKQSVATAVQRAVVLGHSASQTAQEFLARGEAVPGDIQGKLGEAHPEKIGRAAGAALIKNEGSAYAHAQRVFRTEINRAHGNAYLAAAEKTPDAIGSRFNLSPAHPRPDICDMHAKANIYGLGDGVYPFGKNPWPAHPNTLSFVTVVFKDEVKPADKAGKETHIDWLHQQPPAMQAAVLDSQGKAAALRKGLLTANMIRTPWRVVKERLEKRGVDTADLAPAKGNPIDSPAAKERRVRPIGEPVSNALDVRGAKNALADALAAIDSVHGDGTLPKIPVLASRGTRTLGSYRYTRFGGQPLDISVSSKGHHQALTAVHEIGHFLDHQALFKPGAHASAQAPAVMAGYLAAVEDSAAIKQLRQMAAKPPSIKLADGRIFTVDRSHINYLLDPREIWARAYSQYISMRSGNLRLISELDDTVSRQRNAPISYQSQWEAADFAPVATEMDKLFQAMGWRSGHG